MKNWTELNAKVDAAVLEAIRAGSKRQKVLAHAMPHALLKEFDSHPHSVIDRSLQRLRSAGKIVWDRKEGWSVT